MGYFLSKNEDASSQKVIDFFEVLKLYEEMKFSEMHIMISIIARIKLFESHSVCPKMMMYDFSWKNVMKH